MYKRILLITVDCLRYDATQSVISILRNAARKSGMDIAFLECYSGGPFTWSSLPVIFSSTCPFSLTYGSMKERVSFVEILKSKYGYLTIGIPNNPVASPAKGYNKGYLVYEYYFDNKYNVIDGARHILHVMKMEPFIGSLINGTLNVLTRGRLFFKDCKEITKDALGIITTYRDKRLFLWVHLMDLHYPYGAYSKLKLGLGKTSRIITKYHVNSKLSIFNETFLQNLRELYIKSLVTVMECISLLLEILMSENILQNTLVLITADHGEELYEHGALGHSGLTWFDKSIVHLYNELIRVPLIIIGDMKSCDDYSIITPKEFETKSPLIHHIDIAPTLMSLAVGGAEAAKYSRLFMGKPIPYLVEHAPRCNVISEASAYFLKGYEKGRAYAVIINDNGHKYKYIFNEVTGEEFFDLERDPKETENVIDSHLDLAIEARKVIHDHLRIESKYRIRHKLLVRSTLSNL